MNFWVGLIRRKGLTQGGFFKVWHFPQGLANKRHNFLNQLNLNQFFCESFLELRYYSVIMLAMNMAPWGFVRWGFTYKTDFIGGELFQKDLFQEGSLSKPVP